MPVKKQEAHRALELLEDYHARLGGHDDRALRIAIERVIRIFKSRLFQALLDIQEFYELTLLDESKTVDEKTAETLLIASKWERENTIKTDTNGSTTLPLTQAFMNLKEHPNLQEFSINSTIDNHQNRVKSDPFENKKDMKKDIKMIESTTKSKNHFI